MIDTLALNDLLYLGYKSSLNDLLQELLKIVQLLIWFKINSLIRDFKLEQSQPIH